MQKKGQAAMEFLMTYGWAILVAVIVVGVLWWLIGNPTNLVGNTYQISTPLVKGAMAIATDGVTIDFRNGAGEAITLSSVVISKCGTNATTQVIADGAISTPIEVACTLTSGSRFKGDITVSYTTAGSTITQTSTGSVSGKVP